MTKKEIIELYLADLNNLVPNSDAKRSRIIDLEDELEALLIHDIAEQKQHLIDMMRGDEELGLYKEQKEKAKQLFDTFYYVKDEQGFHSVNKYRAKQCALKAVDELIYENEYLEEIVQAGLKKQFWEKVKQEIEKL